jgi:hypothetical protein
VVAFWKTGRETWWARDGSGEQAGLASEGRGAEGQVGRRVQVQVPRGRKLDGRCTGCMKRRWAWVERSWSKPKRTHQSVQTQEGAACRERFSHQDSEW